MTAARNNKIGRLLAALALALLAAAAQADTRLLYDGANGVYTVSITANAIRIDTAHRPWQLYLRQSNTMFSVNPQSHSYTRLDATIAATLRQQIQALRARIETQLNALPAAQAAALQAALAEQLPGFAGKTQLVTVQRTDLHDAAAGVACEIVQLVRGDAVMGRLCIATPAALGLSTTEAATLTAMFRLMHGMLVGTGFDSMNLPWAKLDGLPVRLQAAGNDKQRTLTAISHQPLDKHLFILPKQFVERTPAALMRR